MVKSMTRAPAKTPAPSAVASAAQASSPSPASTKSVPAPIGHASPPPRNGPPRHGSRTPRSAGSSAISHDARTADHCGPEEHARRLREATVSDDQLERAAAIFRAAGDLSRLKLLHRLCDGEWCVTELAEAAGVGLSTVSQQLRLLRAERIVGRRRAGKHIFYSLADAHVIALIRSAIDHASESHSHHRDDRDVEDIKDDVD
jgi:ArsR family transcriptional regulator